jgi:uncharacterized membrane protein YfcA
MDISSLAIIFFVAILASAFGALIGGSSIITIPTLILLGLPPHTAIGTDRFGIIGIGLAGWYKFQKMGLINYRIGFTIAIPVLLGSALGSNLVLQISEGVLKNVIIILNILILIFILLNPDIGVEKKAAPLTNRRIAIGALLSFLVGIYGGFYGALAGTFVLYILILWFQLTFIQGAADRDCRDCIFHTSGCGLCFRRGHVGRMPDRILSGVPLCRKNRKCVG